MSNLAIAVIALAVAQALTILLTLGREREIRKLRERVTEQRMLIGEIRGWLMRERIELTQARPIKPDHEPKVDDTRVPEPPIKSVPAIASVTEPAITPKDLADTAQPSTTEDELKRATKAINWLKADADKAREIVAVLHGKPPEKIG
jgi:hypothetical protein